MSSEETAIFYLNVNGVKKTVEFPSDVKMEQVAQDLGLAPPLRRLADPSDPASEYIELSSSLPLRAIAKATSPQSRFSLFGDHHADSGAATGQLLSPSTISQLRNACFMVKGDGAEFVGAGVFFRSGVAITARHNLPKHAKKGSMVSIRMAKGCTSTPMQRQLKVVSLTTVQDESDFAVMKTEEETDFIPMWKGDVQELEVCKVFICAFHLGLNEHLLGLRFDEAKLKIVEGTSVGTSTDARFFLYTSNTFRGDSGAGIVTVGGELIGIHLAGVNSIRHAKLHGSQQPPGIEELVSNMVELASSHASSAENTGNAQIGLFLRTLDL